MLLVLALVVLGILVLGPDGEPEPGRSWRPGRPRLPVPAWPSRSWWAGRTRGSGGALSVEFYGGTLAQPRTPAELDQTAAGLLREAFAANFPNLAPVDDQVRSHHPGPLGGQLWCTSYQGGYFACGWLDQQTLGYVFVSGGTEAGAAEVLVGMREDTEVR